MASPPCILTKRRGQSEVCRRRPAPLAGDPAAIPAWEAFLQDCGVRVIARIHSDYHGAADDPCSDPLVVHYLERGQDVATRPVIQRVAQIILEEVGVMSHSSIVSFVQDGVLSIPALAQALDKKPVKRVLPNGREVSQIVWEGSDLVQIARLLHNRSGELPERVDIDGPAPAWLVAALVHELHPRAVRVNSPDGFVPIGCRRPEGPEGYGAGVVKFCIEEQEAGGWLLVTCYLTDPSMPLAPHDLTRIVPPEVPMGARVVLSGRMPNWLAASLAMAYHGRAKAVALFQPGTGATVAWTHSREVLLGTVLAL